MFFRKLIIGSASAIALSLSSIGSPAAEQSPTHHSLELVSRVIVEISRALVAGGADIIDFEPGAGGVRLAAFGDDPARSMSRPQSHISHGAFDSVAIPVGNIGMANKWRAVTSKDYSSFFTGQCQNAGFANCNARFGQHMRRLHDDARGKSELAQMRMINRGINEAIQYKPDQANWGVGDYWATPSEIARNGAGDCEDYAIAKMWMLRSLGFSTEQLQIVVLQDTRRQIYHAVLVVHIDGERYILDNLSNNTRLDDAVANYMPLVSFVGTKSFIHGFDQRRTTTAMPGDLGAVQPGEGV